jgi:hypothetical protein
MSEIKVNKLSARTSNAITIGDTSDVVSTNTAATFKVTREATRSITGDGSTTTALAAGDIALVNVSSATATVQLPSSPNEGDLITVIDVAQSAASNSITIDRNGKKIENGSNNLTLQANGDMAKLIFTGDTYGWTRVSKVTGDTYVNATGGTETTSGSFKIHTFNSTSNFVVSQVSNTDANNEVSYMVVAGGGGAGGGSCSSNWAGAGGAGGGFREGKASIDCYSASPLNAPGGITVSAQTYPITVGAGGTSKGACTSGVAPSGANSVFSTITSAGGGGGGNRGTPGCIPGHYGANGGSGGGGAGYNLGGVPAGMPKGSGNTPPVSPPQGKDGGQGGWSGGGGGGATTAGSSGVSSPDVPSTLGGGPGGAGATTSISGSPTAFAGGGGGGGAAQTGCTPGPIPSATGGTAGTGGGGAGGNGHNLSNNNGNAGTANTGGGGGGAGGGGIVRSNGANGSAGGSGIVIIRYKYQA